MDELISERLRAISPFASLGRRQREELAANGEVLEPRPGAPLFAQGDWDDFDLFLLRGTIGTVRLEAGGDDVSAGSEASNQALCNQQPRPCEAYAASKDVLLLKLQRARVETAVARNQMTIGALSSRGEAGAGDEPVEESWRYRVLQSGLFRELPTENIDRFFEAIEPREFEAGAAIVEQGEPGDYFYIVAEGKCAVMRGVNGVEYPIATLQAGDSFGEEALISGQPRNATVRAQTRSLLMRLDRDGFSALVQKPTIRSIPPAEARTVIEQGDCLLLDVRMEIEHQTWSLPGSSNIPLYRLRDAADHLPRDKPVIVYCDTGARSKVAAFLLGQRDINARFAEGGLAALRAPT